MVQLGVDFSIINPGFCMETDGLTKFMAIQREIGEDLLVSLEEAGVIIHTIPPKEKPEKNITSIERSNSKDAHSLTSFAVEKVNELTEGRKLDRMGMEGLSFMSRSNIVSQFSGYHYVFRETMNRLVSFDEMYVFTPMTVKKIAGKGNYKKEQMIDAFIASDDQSKFHNEISTRPEQFQSKSGKWLKPIDDLVDAYWVLQTMKQLFPLPSFAPMMDSM